MLLQLILTSFVAAQCLAEVDLITDPKPGEEYVFVKSAAIGELPLKQGERAVRSQDAQDFESAHKIPHHTLETRVENTDESDEEIVVKKPEKNNKKLDKSKYHSSGPAYLTTAAPPTSESVGSKINAGLAALVEDDHDELTLETSPSEQKHHSRIQIKKGPNGQDYEYEYVYYYYDDEDPVDTKNSAGKSKGTVPAKTVDGGDGPASDNRIQQASASKTRNRYSSIERGATASSTTAAPEQNEVVPSERGGRFRSRQSGQVEPTEEEEVSEERLPVSTRFPPRSRQYSTTESVESSSEEAGVEDQKNKGRGRNTVRRPSLELVDSASFKTHAGDASASQYRDIDNQHSKESAVGDHASAATEGSLVEQTTEENDGTTMTSMDKVALDLYAYLAGENLNNGDATTEVETTDATTETELETTTVEEETTTAVPTTTTPTTTTTTTEATTTTVAPAGRNRFRLRNGSRTKLGASTTTLAPATSEEPSSKPKNRFSLGASRPSFGRGRTTAKPRSTDAVEEIAVSEDAKPVANARPSIGRNRFNLRGRTTPSATADSQDSSSDATPSPVKPSRPRPSFGIRSRNKPVTTTAATAEETAKEHDVNEEIPVSPKPARGRLGARPVRPLHKGATGTRRTTSSPADSKTTNEKETVADSEHAASEGEVVPDSTTTPSGLNKLRQRPRLQITSQKAKHIAPSNPLAANRRANPLIARRKLPGAVSPAPAEVTDDVTVADDTAANENPEDEKTANKDENLETSDDKAEPEVTSETPKGLSGLLSGRRRLAGRKPGTI